MMPERILSRPEETEAVGAALAPALAGRHGLVALRGELGAGKTTVVRGLLHALGHDGAVRSPTYTLVEPYMLAGQRILHLDLYRLAAVSDLEALGVREELGDGALLIIEWPERAGTALPQADLELTLEHDGDARRIRGAAHTALGRDCLAAVFASD